MPTKTTATPTAMSTNNTARSKNNNDCSPTPHTRETAHDSPTVYGSNWRKREMDVEGRKGGRAKGRLDERKGEQAKRKKPAKTKGRNNPKAEWRKSGRAEGRTKLMDNCKNTLQKM